MTAVFNIAKGRVAEFYWRVDNNDPANSVLLIVPVLTAGLESDATLIDKADLAAVFAGTTDEATTGNWARKTLTDADLSALTVDNTNDRMPAAVPQVSWLNVTGGAISKMLVAYDSDSTGGADSAIIPLTLHDYAISPDGTDIVLPTGDFFRGT